jgi:hypothetical protein
MGEEMDIRYIKGDSKGWLRARRENGREVELPEFLKVEFIETKADSASGQLRDHFKVLEGRERGTLASVRHDKDKPWLGAGNPGWRGPSHVYFSLSKQELTYPGGLRMTAVSEGGPPVPVGVHDLELPDVSHALGAAYLGGATRAKSWFFIGHAMNGARVANRYLHVGSVSAGCVTVRAVEQWDRSLSTHHPRPQR